MNRWNRVSQYHVAALLLLVTVAVYLQVWSAGFVNYDDEAYVTANTHVQSGLTYEGTLWAFNVGYEGNWHPLTWLSHMLDCQLFGPSPIGPHAVNLLLHLANTLLLLLVLNRTTGSLWKSAFVAALFAVHPLHVESVAWVSERKDVLSTLFWFLTMWAYVRYTESPSLKRYGVVTAFFALGLMSKPTLMTLPFLLLLLDYWPLGRWSEASRRERWRLVRQKLPLFAMSLTSGVLTYVAQHKGGAIRTVIELPLSSRISTAIIAYVSYMAKMLWPAKLAVFYPHPVSVPLWHILAAAVFLAAVTTLVIRSARSRPYLVVGCLWYVVVLAPMIGLIQVGDQAIADRYTYVSLIGLFIMFAWGVPASIEAFRHKGKGESGDLTCQSIVRPLGVLSLIAIAALAACTWRQTGYWHDSINLWTHTLAVTTENGVGHYNLGLALQRLGRTDEAIDQYEQAIRIRPDDAEALNNQGAAYGALGRIDEAIEKYKQAIGINPDYADAYNGLGAAYGQLGRSAEAMDAFKQAIRIDPDNADAHYDLGLELYKLGRSDEAIEEYKQAIGISADAETYNSLGAAYGDLGKVDEAIDAFSQAVRMKPGLADAHGNLAIALFNGGRYAEAWEQVRICEQYGVKLPPDFLEALSSKMPAPE